MGMAPSVPRDCPRYPGQPCRCNQSSIRATNPAASELIQATAPIQVRIPGGDSGVPCVSPCSLPTLYEGPC